MKALIGVLIAAGVSGGAVLALRLIEQFRLPAMAYWTIQPDALAFASACAGVMLGYPHPPSVRARWFRTLLGLGALAASFFWYDSLAGTEPTVTSEGWHKLQSYVAFPLCHASFGYVTAPLARFFAERISKPKSGG